MSLRPVLGLTMGDPAGIGPELCLRALCEPAALPRCVPELFGNAGVVRRLVASGIPRLTSRVLSLAEWAEATAVTEALVVDCATLNAADFQPGQISAACGRAAYAYLEQAIRAAVDHGTAFDIAWPGRANPQSLFAAIRVAADLAARHKRATA